MVGISIWHCEVMKKSCFELESKTLTIILHIGCVLNLMSSRCTQKLSCSQNRNMLVIVSFSKLSQELDQISQRDSQFAPEIDKRVRCYLLSLGSFTFRSRGETCLQVEHRQQPPRCLCLHPEYDALHIVKAGN